jgi:nucleolysin TIA-1/TIAR
MSIHYLLFVVPNPSSEGGRTLYVGQLDPTAVDENALYSIFSSYGAIASQPKIIRDRVSGASLGYGFVEFADPASAKAALEALNGRTLAGSELKINWAHTSHNRYGYGGYPSGPNSSPYPVYSSYVPYGYPPAPAAPAAAAPYGGYQVFVGDLPQEVDDAKLREIFGAFGSVLEARVMTDTQTGRSRGYAFVSFGDRDAAQHAIAQMNGFLLGSKRIRCNWATPRQAYNNAMRSTTQQPGQGSAQAGNGSGAPGSSQLTSAPPSSTSSSVYVGNLAPETSDTQLRSIFANYGPVRDVRIMVDKGFAFVHMGNHEAAGAAIAAMNGQEINGRLVRCSWGRERVPVHHMGMPLGHAGHAGHMGHMGHMGGMGGMPGPQGMGMMVPPGVMMPGYPPYQQWYYAQQQQQQGAQGAPGQGQTSQGAQMPTGVQSHGHQTHPHPHALPHAHPHGHPQQHSADGAGSHTAEGYMYPHPQQMYYAQMVGQGQSGHGEQGSTQ